MISSIHDIICDNVTLRRYKSYTGKMGSNHDVFRFNMKSNQAISVCKWLYENSIENTRLDRKYNIWNP